MKIPSWFPWLGFLAGLRARLILLVLLAILPMLGLILHTDLEQRYQQAAEVQTDALNVARMATDTHRDHIENARQLLATLALLPQIRGADPAPCNELLARVVKQSPLYANLVVTEPNGDIFCSAIPFTAQINIADQLNFKRALGTREFVVGGYQVGRISHKASLAVGYPLLNAANNVERVLTAGLDLAWMNQYPTGIALLSGSRLAVIDRAGVILIHQPDPENWVGNSVADVEIVKTVLAQGEGTADGLGLDNTSCLAAFTPLDSDVNAATFLLISIPRATAFAKQDALLRQNLFALATVTVLGLLIAWLFGNWFIVRRVKTLVNATQRLAAGDLSARTTLPYGVGELSQLAQHFDAMAHTLEQRAAQQQQNEKQLRESENKFRVVADFTYDWEFWLNPAGQFVYVSPSCERITGYAAAQFCADPTLFERIIHPDDQASVTAHREMVTRKRQSQEIGFRIIRADGTVRWIEHACQPVFDATNNFIGARGSNRDVTERHAILAALQQVETQYHSLVEQLPVFVYRVEFGQDGKWLYASPQIEKFLGFTTAELMADKGLWRRQLHPNDVKIAVGAGVSSRDTGKPFQVEYRMFARDGRIVWVRDEAIVIPATAEHPAYLQGIMTDVTAHRQIEEAIHESEERFRTFIEQTSEGVVLADETGRIIEWNSAMANMVGIPREHALGTLAWEIQVRFAPPDDPRALVKERWDAAIANMLQNYANGPASRVYQIAIRTAEDAERILAQHSFVIRTANGYRIGSVVRDVTEQKRIERELHDERDFVLQVVNTMGQGLTVTDGQGRFIFVNPAYARMAGYSVTELLGKRPSDVTAPASRDTLFQAYAERLAGKTTTYESHFQRPDGRQVRVLITGAPRMQDGKYSGAIAVVTDLTERMQMEQALRESQRQLALVLEGSNDGFWDWNIASGAVQYSERWAGMLGYRLDELEPSLKTWEHLVHPDDFPRVQRAIQDLLAGHSPYYETEHRLRTKSDEWKWVLDRGKIVERDETGKPLRATGTHTDITARVKAQEQLKYLSTHDALTQLYNRAYFESELTRLDHSRQFPVSVVMIDVDGLKRVNDQLGHPAGDDLLRRAATVMIAAFRTEDVIARIGGDEFAVILPHTDAHAVNETRFRLHRQLQMHNKQYPNQPLSISIGIATAPPGSALGETVRQADAQMYREKEEHRKS